MGRRQHSLLGFTLIETLLVLTIIAVMAVLSVPFYQSFQIRTQLDDRSEEIVQSLRKAQSKAMAVEDDKVFGVHFENNKFVLFKNTPYNPDDPDNEITDLPATLSISFNLNGGGSEVVFDKLKGTTANDGTVSISSVNNESRTINVSQVGKIEVGAVP